MLKFLTPVLILVILAVSPAAADMDTANQYLHSGDHARAAEEFRKLAEAGDPKAQAHLGYMYYTGDGVPQSFSEALKWYEKAAVQGDRDAQYNLAVAYAFGEGVQQNFKDAAIWYRRAAEQGHAAAQYSLGISYAYGEGVEQDQQIAGEWFLKSAAAGYVNAQVMVGSMYHTGEGLPKDYRQAASWYHKAAEQGNAAAQYNLGTLYRAGKGVDKNMDEAVKWLRQAADQGYASAQNELSSLERSMAATVETAEAPVATDTAPALSAPVPATAPVPETSATPPLAPPQTSSQETTLTAEAEPPPPEERAPPPGTLEEKPGDTATIEPVAAVIPETVPEAGEAIQTPEPDAGPGEKRGGFLAGLKKFFTPPREQVPATPAAEMQEATAVEAAAPQTEESEDVSTATAYPVTEGAPATTVAQLTPEEPVRKTPAQAAPASAAAGPAEIPPPLDVTSDFHKLFGDRRNKTVPDTGVTQAPAMATTDTPPAPPPLPAAPEPLPAETPPAAATTAGESRDITPAAAAELEPGLPPTPTQPSMPATPESQSGETAPAVAGQPGTDTTATGAQAQAGGTAGTEDSGTWRPGGLRRIFDKFLTGKRDTGPATQSAVTDIAEGHATAAPEPAPVAKPTSVSADAETVPAEISGAGGGDEEPLVVAKAEPDTVTPTLAESAAEELQTPIDELTSNAVQGDFEAQYLLGKKYYLGDGVTADQEQAFMWLRRAAEQGHADAQYQLGNMYLMGEGVGQNDAVAAAWYTQAADQGHDAARQNLEKLQRLAEQTAAQETEAAVPASAEEPAAKKGILGSLGKFFSSAKEEQAMEPESAPDDAGSVAAVAADTGVTETSVTAAPGQNDYERGLAYSDGDGVPQDYRSALMLFESAAEQNYAPAQFRLGNAYLGGEGIEKDLEAALSWYEKSARQGYAPAQRTLGNLYMYGAEGVAVNKALAYAWYSILSREGNMLDQHRRDILRAELSDQELRESEKMKQELTASLPATPVSEQGYR